MALTMFVHDGDAVDYTPAADVAVGAVVVQGELVGVARSAIKAGEVGSLAVTGVFDFPKADGSAISAGANCYWDATNQVATTTDSGNKLIGKCVAAAVSADTKVRIRLMQ